MKLGIALPQAGGDGSRQRIAFAAHEAERIGLITQAVPAAELDAAVQKLADRMKGVPKNQLWMQKTAINSAFENMGMRTTQTLATLFDGMTRHSPEGI